MYTILEYVKKLDHGKERALVTITVDTESDIPSRTDPEWLPGSCCIIADDHKIKLLNHKGEWV